MSSNKAIATRPQTPLAQPGFTDEQVRLIKAMVSSSVTLSDVEFALFLNQCERTGLDPLAKQIHAVKRQGKLVIQTAIDGYRLIADRTGKYAGSDDPVYDSEKETHPRKATVTVWKLVGGQRVPFTRSARWAEFCPDGNQAFMWKKMPFHMLGKCAEALALRAAFPQELSGLYTHEEMDQAVDAEVVGVKPPEPQKQLAASTPKAAAPANGANKASAHAPPKTPKEFDVFYDGLVKWCGEKGKATPEEVQEETKRYAASQDFPENYLDWNEKAFAAVYLWLKDWGQKRPVKAATSQAAAN